MSLVPFLLVWAFKNFGTKTDILAFQSHRWTTAKNSKFVSSWFNQIFIIASIIDFYLDVFTAEMNYWLAKGEWDSL